MTTARTFIDVHLLQSVPPSCINRDDTGSPKTAVYGGVRRARVSSQAWKRATRTRFEDELDAADLGVRTKRVVELVAEQIERRRGDLDEATRVELARAVVAAAGLKLEKPRKGGIEESQFLVLVSRQQAATLADLALRCLDEATDLAAGVAAVSAEKRAAKEALKQGSSIDLALFGRMVANDTDLNVDASCQVAHALSVHAADPEFDYFTAVDDLQPTAEDGEAANAGAGMIGTIEFTSATLYRYATIDVEELAHSLGDDAPTARRAIEAFLRAFTLSMPTGKVNTFANNTLPDGIVVAVRTDQPVSWVGAFEQPVVAGPQGGYLVPAAGALASWARSLDEAYGRPAARAWSVGVGPVADVLAQVGDRVGFADLPAAVAGVATEHLAVAP